MSAHSKSGEAGVPPRVSVILDDMRWEEKLRIARERRAEVLAQKAAENAKDAPVAPPPDAWKAALAAPLAMDAVAPPAARPTVTPILPPVVAPMLADEDAAVQDNGNRKRIAALAASVAVAAILAGSALTNGDPSFEGGFVSLFRTTDGASAPDIEVAALGLSTVPLEVDGPDLSDMGLTVPTSVDRSLGHGGVVAPDGPTVLPNPVDTSARAPVQVAAASPRALDTLQPVAGIDRPAPVADPARIASGQAPVLPTAAAGALPVASAANPVPDVQDTVMAFAAGANDATTVPPLSTVRAVEASLAPQVLESQGAAEAGWTPAVGLGVALPIRLSVFAPSALATEPVAALVASVEAGAKTNSVVSPVDFAVSKTHVRYYREEDLPAAKQVASLAGGTVRDFTDYAPQPARGTVELWLAGSPEPRGQGGETVLASLQPPSAQAPGQAPTPAAVPTATVAPAVTTPVTPVPKVTRRKGILNSIFGRSGFYKNPRPAPAAAPAPAPTPVPTIGRFKNSVLGTLNGSGIANASRLGTTAPAASNQAAASPTQTATAAAPASNSGGNKLRAGKVKQAQAKAAAAAAAAAQSKANSKPKAGPGRWK